MLRNSQPDALDREEKAIEEWAKYNEHQKSRILHKFPRAVHDCGLYANDCNYRGSGPDRKVMGSFMKQAQLQSLDQISEITSEV